MRAMRAAGLLRGAAALAVLLLLEVGLPVLLLAVSGNPLPGSPPSVEQIRVALTSPDDGTLLLGVLTWVAWIGWGVFTVSVVADVVARLRGVRAPRLGPQQRVASMLVGAVAAIAVAAPAGAAAPSIEPVAAAAPAAVVPLHVVVGEDTVVVETGDTLWDIADEELDDPTRYPEIYEASTGTVQPGGRRLTDPDHIEPGWTLTLPGSDVLARDDPAEQPTADAEEVVTPLNPAGYEEAEAAWRDNVAAHSAKTAEGDWRDRISTPFAGER